ncbi:MAG: poly-gamma-glutamate biosynthesis protein PgsC [Spirochaetes bacterium]|nr:poly-gamma-glutamate biosynthesis protein PgsC [Spirochaetota bacterium]
MTGASVALGIIASFLYTELTGLLAGGLVGAGYLALYLERPGRILATLLAAGAARLIVGFLSERVIIYGRRRFMALVLAGMAFAWLADLTLSFLPSFGQDFRIIGYIVPGLIANDAWKQGYLKTCLSVLIVAALVRLALLLVL